MPSTGGAFRPAAQDGDARETAWSSRELGQFIGQGEGARGGGMGKPDTPPQPAPQGPWRRRGRQD
eukprot:14415592-Alexandrium_andersonii.AAC.1